MYNEVFSLVSIDQLVEKIKQLEVENKILFQIIEKHDNMLNKGNRKENLPLLPKTLIQKEKTKNKVQN